MKEIEGKIGETQQNPPRTNVKSKLVELLFKKKRHKSFSQYSNRTAVYRSTKKIHFIFFTVQDEKRILFWS